MGVTTRPGSRARAGVEQTGDVTMAIDHVVRQALAEDVGPGDVTTNALVGPETRCRARILIQEPGVVCGVPAAEAVFRALDPAVTFEATMGEGENLAGPGQVAMVEGSARAVLTGERTALNLLGRLCGVATLARSFVDAVAGTGAVILDTRKTTPGLRTLEKYAIRVGGATNHRFGLYDRVLVKDNHLRLAGDIGAAVRAIRERAPGLPVEVEVETLADARAALDAGADVLLLDNMSVADLTETVALVSPSARLEASGGVTLANARAVAETGVDFMSVGAITHAARSLDVSLEVL
jgi:nicotinate-nucleotide pyrophosphorylase (carboxylating)